MDEIPEDLKLLYFDFGRAAEMAQLMEVQAGNLALTFASLSVDPSKITNEERRFFSALIEDVNSRTFGNLIKQIRKIGTIDDGIEKAIDEALDKRNYLVHEFFRRHNLRINSEEGRTEMRTELAHVHESLSRAHAMLSAMTDTLSQAFGRPTMSHEQVAALMHADKRLEI